jgi:hypothetical protein
MLNTTLHSEGAGHVLLKYTPLSNTNVLHFCYRLVSNKNNGLYGTNTYIHYKFYSYYLQIPSSGINSIELERMQ